MYTAILLFIFCCAVFSISCTQSTRPHDNDDDSRAPETRQRCTTRGERREHKQRTRIRKPTNCGEIYNKTLERSQFTIIYIILIHSHSEIVCLFISLILQLTRIITLRTHNTMQGLIQFQLIPQFNARTRSLSGNGWKATEDKRERTRARTMENGGGSPQVKPPQVQPATRKRYRGWAPAEEDGKWAWGAENKILTLLSCVWIRQQERRVEWTGR